jgi:hypothetical protein
METIQIFNVDISRRMCYLSYEVDSRGGWGSEDWGGGGRGWPQSHVMKITSMYKFDQWYTIHIPVHRQTIAEVIALAHKDRFFLFSAAGRSFEGRGGSGVGEGSGGRLWGGGGRERGRRGGFKLETIASAALEKSSIKNAALWRVKDDALLTELP